MSKNKVSIINKAKIFINWLGYDSENKVEKLIYLIKNNNTKSNICNVYPNELTKRFWLQLIIKCLIICNDDVVRRITTSKFKDKYIKETKNNRYMFNTLLVSDKITNEIKKAIWEDFLQIKDYE